MKESECKNKNENEKEMLKMNATKIEGEYMEINIQDTIIKKS